jgi:hypothetical protein
MINEYFLHTEITSHGDYKDQEEWFDEKIRHKNVMTLSLKKLIAPSSAPYRDSEGIYPSIYSSKKIFSIQLQLATFLRTASSFFDTPPPLQWPVQNTITQMCVLVTAFSRLSIHVHV